MWTEERLNKMLTTPSEALSVELGRLEGDILVLGAGGKMGPTLCVLAKNALRAAGVEKRVIAVSRFSDPLVVELLRENGVEMISADLLAPGALDSLPDAENVIYMAGKKFGTDGNEYATWAMNTWLPSRVAERYQNSRIVVFSSGNLYPKVGVHSGGATEETRTEPVGEYCMSCQGRERMFEYAAKTYGTRVAVYRLNYAVDLRYGVLYDMAHNILEGKPISITTPSFNCIWQGDANEAALRLLGHASAEVFTLNVTGPETAGVQETAKKAGRAAGQRAHIHRGGVGHGVSEQRRKDVPAVRLSHGAAGNADRMAGTVDFGRRARIGQAHAL